MIIAGMQRFPDCAAWICLMSERGDMRGSRDEKPKSHVDISLVLLQTLCIF